MDGSGERGHQSTQQGHGQVTRHLSNQVASQVTSQVAGAQEAQGEEKPSRGQRGTRAQAEV